MLTAVGYSKVVNRGESSRGIVRGALIRRFRGNMPRLYDCA